ncbi:MAG: LysM peptidoglycan-binding domain-containing protein [Acidobacteria bacterium]|nr:LysM peptidoglycan-binding domain-containing protein [Acidobacteriota bacterium]MCA1619862.1 LysM peptidoglycan-binding domain-containing protein [Acidobacteriota bacterium]
MAVRDKYQSLIDLANQGGVSNLRVNEEGDVLHVSGTVGSEEAKKKLWDEYNRLDPDMRSGDLILNVEVGGGDPGRGEADADTYTVKSGDSLSAIGKHHGVAWRDIHEANRDVIGDNPDLIKPGQKLRIPKK